MIWPTAPFLDAVRDASGGNLKVPQREYLSTGALAVVDQGQSLIGGYTDSLTARHKSVGPVIVFGDHTKALKYVDFPFAMGADGVKVLEVLDGWDPRFVYHYLQTVSLPDVGWNKAFLGEVLPSDRSVKPGDLLMTRKNTKDHVGAVAFVSSTPDRLLLPDLIFRLNYDSQLVQPIFLQRLLMTGRMRVAVRGLASGSAASMPNISKARLLALPLPMPSLTRQEDFVGEAKSIEVVRARAGATWSELRALFTSLQARAFSGRL